MVHPFLIVESLILTRNKAVSESNAMTPSERRATRGLAAVYGVRMLGLFLILPVFALFAEDLPGSTPMLAGLAIGIYGLTQAILQIPFGLLSDRLGRKPVILAGLVLFAAGSVLAALGTDIWQVILGRALQGSGAVAAAVMALAADLTRESQRTKAMASIGMTIGGAFMLALIAGPLLDAWIGVPGIFWLTAVLAVVAMALIAFVVPKPVGSSIHRDAEAVPALFGRVLRNSELLRLNFGIFSLHLLLTALFLAVPHALEAAGLPLDQHSWLYLGVMALSIATMVPFIIQAERHGRMKPIFIGAVAVLIAAQLVMYLLLDGFWGLAVGLWLFFSAFNLLEASLPSLVSKIAPAASKGTAMGVYSTSQFSGAFVGGVLGGWAYETYGIDGVFLLGSVIAGLWLLVALGMRRPGQYSSQLLHVGKLDNEQAEALAARLHGVSGVIEAVVVADEGVAYLKIDKQTLDQSALDEIHPAA